MTTWDDVEDQLLDFAQDDLELGADAAAPCLMAFAGPRLRFIAFVRPFEKGAYHQPLIELLALAVPLGSDRLAFSATGRAWSLDDPIAPVVDGADLRQRVLMLELVDGSRGKVARRSVLVPFQQAARRVTWGDRRELPASESWIGGVLELAVGEQMRRRMTTDDAAVAAQAERVAALGHDLRLAMDLHERLERCSSPGR